MRRLWPLLGVFLWAGCECQEGVRRVRAELLLPPEVKDFGAVPVLNEKLDRVEVFNAGRAALKVLGARIVEQGAAFSVKSAPTEVASSEGQPIELGFLPTREADYSATLLLETDDEDNPRVEVKLTGQGSTRAVMEVEPAALDFGRVGECTSAVKSFVIRSRGTADLVVNALGFAEGTSAAFSFVGSTRTPAVVKPVGSNGLPGQIQLTVKYTVAPGDSAPSSGGILIRGTDPDRMELLLPLSGQPNRAPLPAIAPLGNGAPGMTVSLDATGSTDPDGDLPLSYKWTMRNRPLGARTQLLGPEQPLTSITLDPALPGEYEVELQVTDAAGVKSCAPARAKVVATPAQKLLVEMFWNHPKTDLDLHVLRTPTTMVTSVPDDCYYANPRPDWGVSGERADDPELLRDALTGYGPEVLGYVSPIDTTYRVAVELAHDHLDPNPASEVTVRIYEFGVVRAELKKTLLVRGEVWPVADIEWPSGVIRKLP